MEQWQLYIVLSFDHELRTLFLIKMFINNNVNNNQLIQIIDNAVWQL